MSIISTRGRIPDEFPDLPTCRQCGGSGTLVETVTDTIVLHHENAHIENHHDFEPSDGRSTIVHEPKPKLCQWCGTELDGVGCDFMGRVMCSKREQFGPHEVGTQRDQR